MRAVKEREEGNMEEKRGKREVRGRGRGKMINFATTRALLGILGESTVFLCTSYVRNRRSGWLGSHPLNFKPAEKQ